MALVNRVIVSYKSKGKIISKETMRTSGRTAFVAPEAPATEEVSTPVPTPKCFSAKPTIKATPSKPAVQEAKTQLAIQTSPRMSKVGSGNGGHRQTFTWGDQTIPVH